MVLRVAYDKDQYDKSLNSSLNTNFVVEFPVLNWAYVARYVRLELIDTRDRLNPKKVKSVHVDLRGINVDNVTKMVDKFREDTKNTVNDNFTTSEAEFSILLVGIPQEQDGTDVVKQPTNLIIPDITTVK